MAFTVHYERGDNLGADSYDDTHELVIKDWGIIEVKQRGEQIQLYSPNFWTHVKPGGQRRTLPGRP